MTDTHNSEATASHNPEATVSLEATASHNSEAPASLEAPASHKATARAFAPTICPDVGVMYTKATLRDRVCGRVTSARAAPDQPRTMAVRTQRRSPRAGPIKRATNAWTPKSERAATPRSRIENIRAEVRRVMNKLPSSEAVHRQKRELEAKRRELGRQRGGRENKELVSVENKLREMRGSIEEVVAIRHRLIASLTTVEVTTADEAEAFIAAFVGGILPASTTAKDDGAESALFESAAQACSVLRRDAAWTDQTTPQVAWGAKVKSSATSPAKSSAKSPAKTPAASPAKTPAASPPTSPVSSPTGDTIFAWGRKGFVKYLMQLCQARFSDLGAATSEYTPYVKLVAFLIRGGVLNTERVNAHCQHILVERLKRAESAAAAVDAVKLLRIYLEIVAPDGTGKHPSAGQAALLTVKKDGALPEHAALGTLPPRARTEAAIYLERRR